MMWYSIIDILVWVGLLVFVFNTERRVAKLEKTYES